MRGVGIFVLAVAALLSGCGTVPLQREQVDRLSADASLSEVQAMLGKASELRAFGFSFGDKAYRAREYRLQTGATQQTSVVCTPVCYPIVVTVPVTVDYVLVHELGSERLLAWGSMEELSKASDERVSQLMPALKAARAKQLEQSK